MLKHIFQPAYENTYKTESYCDANQCAVTYKKVCPDYAYCTDRCKGYSCTCNEGYIKVKNPYGHAKCVSNKYRSTGVEEWIPDEDSNEITYEELQASEEGDNSE